MNALWKSKLWKFGLGLLAFFFAFLLVFPVFFKEKLKTEVEKALQQQVVSELRFGEFSLSFFRHFPSLTISLDNLYLGGSGSFEADTLFFAKELAFGVAVPSLFTEKIKIQEIYLDQATVKILRDKYGNSNFDILPSREQDSVQQDSSTFELEIEGFFFEKSRFVYGDVSLDMVCEANGIDYRGNGNLKDGEFHLQSNIQIEEFILVYDQFPIFNRNRLAADLLTRINTETTALTFERNSLKINELPLNFVGAFEFIPGGYDMNFVLESFDANLKDMMSLIPSDIMPGFGQTRFGGKGDIIGSFQGPYLPAQNQMPGLVLSLSLNDGMIAHSSTAPGIENLKARVNLRVPELDPNLMIFHIDSLGFKLGEGYLNGKIHLENINPLSLNSDIEAKINLGQLHDALGTEGLDYRGDLDLSFHSNGRFRYILDPKELRDPDLIIQSIPVFSLDANLENGFLHWTQLPEPIRDLGISISANTPDSLPGHIDFEMKKLRFQVLEQVTEGFFSYLGRGGQQVNAKLKSGFNLGDIPKFYPLDSGFRLAGQLDLDLVAEGKYLPEKKILPKIQADFTLRDGYILTPYHPEAIQDISCILSMSNTDQSFADLKFDIQPVSFRFAGQPFMFKANLANLDDIQYDLESKGRLDLGKLYRVFGVEGASVEGHLITDLRLKGRQSDAANGRIANLDNSGTLEMEKIQVSVDMLPEPLGLEKGVLTFDQDKIEFRDFLFSYIENQVSASGHLTNYLGYLADENEILSGRLEFQSKLINLDDFMFFGEENPAKTDTLGLVSGVIVPPSNLDLTLIASVDSVRFGEYYLSDFKGELVTAPREIRLNQTRFSLISALVEMSGAYRASSPYSAYFDYRIAARDFDIQRAYQEIPIFKEMVSFAEFAEGKAELEYQLAGRLDANMFPVFPSLKGKGTLGLKAIKLNGFKLMNTMAAKTENEELNDPELNDIEIKTSIENNLITIPKTRMKIAGFRPRIEGQVSLDGDLNLGIRLGLPPLGIFGIPVKITGNAENFEMKVGKSTKEDDLEESFDDAEDLPETKPSNQND